ncbi:hypothetical protein OG563_26685 [Nocardia vinacea]|uniref:Uncharacterized protein n=1 Tax=Nocardia vinacea TaxID=96468 RepID=A0ABZ1YI66_9NOCA|nr:hypothetical protein [Nocardia vinacea]
MPVLIPSILAALLGIVPGPNFETAPGHLENIPGVMSVQPEAESQVLSVQSWGAPDL